ncbi:hypothetical protein SDC9_120953 [bioreactor metagenome]|uniref:Uncharacterized protein n=1 Tax=bioreactor metagenome TaxID=1076179 RepID=A0A645CAN9_9ZZZZ
MDADAPDGDRERLPAQPLAAALGAGMLGHALLQLAAHGVGLGFPVAPLQIVGNALKGLEEGSLTPLPLVGELELLSLSAIEQNVYNLLRQLGHRGVELKAVPLGKSLKIHPGDGVPLDVVPAAGGHRSLNQREGAVGDDEVGVHLQLGAQARAGGTGAVGVVEGKHAGRQLLDGDAAVLAGIVLRKEDVPLLLQHVDNHQTARQGGGCLHRVGEPTGNVGPDHEPVHNDLDVVLFVLLQLNFFRKLVERAVHPAADVAGFARVLEHLSVFALPGAHHGSQYLNPRPLRQGQHLIDDLVDGLLPDFLAALGAVGRAHPCPEQTQVIVNFGYRAHGGARIFGGGLLVDGNGGGQSLDIIHIRLFHLPQKLPGIGRQGLHIPALPLGVDGFKGQ